MGLLEGMGYGQVRDFAGGLEEWTADGGALVPPQVRARMLGRPLHWAGRLIARLDGASARTLFRLGLLLVLASAACYLLLGLLPGSGLSAQGKEVGLGASGMLDALYFSLVTATTLGYGDVTPIGLARIVAVTEALVGLLLFGAVISKFLSKRQEAMVEELHRLTFEDRLGRVQTNLHMVIAELQTLATTCQDSATEPDRVRARVRSAVLVFTSELRAIHDLLFRPQAAPQEVVLEGLLAGLSAALDELKQLLGCPAAANARDEGLDRSILEVKRLAQDICGDCVPQQYALRLREWMDRIQSQAGELG